MRVQLYNALEEFERFADISDIGLIPEVLIVDDHHYIRFRQDVDTDGIPRYKFAVGRQTVHTEAVPIYVARLFSHPTVFETRTLRLFSGCHGVVPYVHDHQAQLSWKEKVIFQVRGLTAIRINGVWSPELSRTAWTSNQQAFHKGDHAAQALAFARKELHKGNGWERPFLRFSGIGVDEYGRMICDVSKFVLKKFTGPEGTLTLFTSVALESGLFSPSRLVVE